MNELQRVLVDDRTYSVTAVRNGGMGRVWLLEQTFEEPFDPIFRRRIAVKTFDFMPDEYAIEKELNIWISLDHRSILPLKKICRLNYRLAALMPLLDGSLADLLDAQGSLSEQDVARILLDVVDGLEYAWSTWGILHLDIKPSNVLIDGGSPTRALLADWGVSRLASAQRLQATSSGRIAGVQSLAHITAYSAGTPLFMAPERFQGNWTLSPMADIYSIGMMAIQLNTGIPPFRFGNVDPVDEILSGSFYTNACQLLEQRSAGFRELCLQCIRPDSSARPKSYRELAIRFSAIKKGK